MRDAMMYVTTAVRPLAMIVVVSSCSGWLAHAWLPYLPMRVPVTGHIYILLRRGLEMGPFLIRGRVNEHKKPKTLKFYVVAPRSPHLQS